MTDPTPSGGGAPSPATPAPLDHLAPNVAHWDGRGEDQLALARARWAGGPVWGEFSIPEADVGLLPSALDGVRAVELGCGTAYVSAWLARAGARPVAVDPTPGQLRIARRCQDEFGLRFPLVRAAGEQVPLAGGAFDLAVSEYGAAIWADPHRWIPEAARLLRPGGELVFLGNGLVHVLTVPDEDGRPATDRLVRNQFGLHRITWPDDDTAEFHLPHGDWIRLLRASGFDVEELLELRPPADATTSSAYVTLDWARRWPAEEAWRARRR